MVKDLITQSFLVTSTTTSRVLIPGANGFTQWAVLAKTPIQQTWTVLMHGLARSG